MSNAYSYLFLLILIQPCELRLYQSALGPSIVQADVISSPKRGLYDFYQCAICVGCLKKINCMKPYYESVSFLWHYFHIILSYFGHLPRFFFLRHQMSLDTVYCALCLPGFLSVDFQISIHSLLLRTSRFLINRYSQN